MVVFADVLGRLIGHFGARTRATQITPPGDISSGLAFRFKAPEPCCQEPSSRGDAPRVLPFASSRGGLRIVPNGDDAAISSAEALKARTHGRYRIDHGACAPMQLVEPGPNVQQLDLICVRRLVRPITVECSHGGFCRFRETRAGAWARCWRNRWSARSRVSNRRTWAPRDKAMRAPLMIAVAVAVEQIPRCRISSRSWR